MDRRSFLNYVLAMAAANSVPLIARSRNLSSEIQRRKLILIELKGGNDAINTFIPFEDPSYYSLRKNIAISKTQQLKISKDLALHPNLKNTKELFDQGNIAIIQNIGYDDPILSHFESIDVWESAQRHSDQHIGWLSQLTKKDNMSLILGDQSLGFFAGNPVSVINIQDPDKFLNKAIKKKLSKSKSSNDALNHIYDVSSSVNRFLESKMVENSMFKFSQFDKNPFSKQIAFALKGLESRQSFRFIKLTLEGFDTHFNQLNSHANKLKHLDTGLKELVKGLKKLEMWEDSLIMTYSEFGRRPYQNANNGTDHGTASTHMVIGPKVKGKVYGPAYDFKNLVNDNFKAQQDFRSMYSTVIDKWFNLDPQKILKEKYKGIDFLS